MKITGLLFCLAISTVTFSQQPSEWKHTPKPTLFENPCLTPSTLKVKWESPLEFDNFRFTSEISDGSAWSEIGKGKNDLRTTLTSGDVGQVIPFRFTSELYYATRTAIYVYSSNGKPSEIKTNYGTLRTNGAKPTTSVLLDEVLPGEKHQLVLPKNPYKDRSLTIVIHLEAIYTWHERCGKMESLVTYAPVDAVGIEGVKWPWVEIVIPPAGQKKMVDYQVIDND